MSINYVSQEGFDSLKNQIAHLEKVERKKISNQIAEARDKGDLSENAEYDAAKEAQGLLEMKISKLKNTLAKMQYENFLEDFIGSNPHCIHMVIRSVHNA
jgi:transcription elongation GreA/GreB family factor